MSQNYQTNSSQPCIGDEKLSQDKQNDPTSLNKAGNCYDQVIGNKQAVNETTGSQDVFNIQSPIKQFNSEIVNKNTINNMLHKRDSQQMSASNNPACQVIQYSNTKTKKQMSKNSQPSVVDDSNGCSGDQYDFDTVSEKDNENEHKAQKTKVNKREQKKSTKLGRPRQQKEAVIEPEDEDDDEYDDEVDSQGRKSKRLVQNRKSAQKCRLKKKAEFSGMRQDIDKYKNENISLKDKLNEVTIMLYNKIEENQYLTKKVDQNQTQHTMFLTKLLLNWHQSGSNSSVQSLQSQIQNHLVTCLDNNTSSRYQSSMQKNLIEQQATDQNNLNTLINQYLQSNVSSSPTMLNQTSDKIGSLSGISGATASTAMSHKLKQLQSDYLSESQPTSKPQFNPSLLAMQSDMDKNPLLASLLQQQTEMNTSANKNQNNSAFTEVPRRDIKGMDQVGLAGQSLMQNMQNTGTISKGQNEELMQYANQIQMMHNLNQAKSQNNSTMCSPMIPTLNNGMMTVNEQLQGLMQQNTIGKNFQQKQNISHQQVLKALLGNTSNNQNGNELRY